MPITKQYNVFVRPGKKGLQVRVRGAKTLRFYLTESYHDLAWTWLENQTMFPLNVAVL